MSKALTTLEETKLNQCAREIREGLAGMERSANQIAFAVRTVNEQRLFRAAHESLEEWAGQIFGFSKRRCYQLIDQADTLDLMAKTEKSVPLVHFSERALRPIAALPEAKRPEAIAEAQRIAAEKEEDFAPKHLRAAAAKFAPPKLKPARSTAEPRSRGEESAIAPAEMAGVKITITGEAADVHQLAAKFRELAAEARRFFTTNEHMCMGDPVAGPLLSRIIGVARNISAQLPE